MNIRKYLIGGGLAVTLLVGAASLVLAEETMEKKVEAMSRPQPMVVRIGPSGRTLLRGDVVAVGTSSLTVKSWGGDWIINISSSTEITPNSDMSQFKAGDFIGVHGTASTSAAWAIDATLVRDWSARKEAQINRQEIREIMKAEKARNWQGIASNVNASARTITLTIDGTAYTVNITTDARIVDENYNPIELSAILDGHKVRVWGPSSETTITASVVRDVSISSTSDNQAKKEIKELIKSQKPRNWEGIASNVNASAKTLTLTIDGVAYTVNVTADARVVDENYLAIDFARIENDHKVRVWGPSSETTITASVVRDVSL